MNIHEALIALERMILSDTYYNGLTPKDLQCKIVKESKLDRVGYTIEVKEKD